MTGTDRLAAAVRLYDADADRKLAENDGTFRECDTDLNDASRELVREFKLAHGAAFLVKLDRSRSADRSLSPVREWDGRLVCNFAADAVVPAFDAELERLILEREAAATHVGDAPRVAAVFARVAAVGGTTLCWS